MYPLSEDSRISCFAFKKFLQQEIKTSIKYREKGTKTQKFFKFWTDYEIPYLYLKFALRETGSS